jgi:hypothetical protein
MAPDKTSADSKSIECVGGTQTPTQSDKPTGPSSAIRGIQALSQCDLTLFERQRHTTRLDDGHSTAPLSS